MRTPLSFLAAISVAVLLTACQASAPVDELPDSDPTATSTSLADSPQMGGTGGTGATASGEHACMHGNQECSTDRQCCSGRCMQAGSASGMCEK